MAEAQTKYELVSRKEAKARGSKHYFTGQPCKRGHIALRYVTCLLCVDCAAMQRKQWRADNPEQTLELQRSWRRNNPERERRSHLKSNKKWYYNTRPTRIAAARAYYATHREAASERARALRNDAEFLQKTKIRQTRWRKEKPHKVRQYRRNRDARKHNGGGRHTHEDILEIFKMQRGKCAYCPKNLGDDYHVDHIVPLAKGGHNRRENIQLLCPKCNRSKGARDPIDHARSLGMLL